MSAEDREGSVTTTAVAKVEIHIACGTSQWTAGCEMGTAHREAREKAEQELRKMVVAYREKYGVDCPVAVGSLYEVRVTLTRTTR